MSLLLNHSCSDRFEPLSRQFEFFRGCFSALLFKTMQHMDDVAHSRQINHTIPSSLILIPELKNSRPYRAHRPVIGRLLPLLQQRRSNPKLAFAESGNELITS